MLKRLIFETVDIWRIIATQKKNKIINHCFRETSAFVLIKRYGSTGNWVIQDNRRSQANPGNPANRDLNPSNNEAEEANNGIDLYANGFKQVNTDGDSNASGSGNTYIYMAFAAAPLVGSNNVPATAR